MNAPSVEIKDILETDSGLGLEYATDLFVGEMPDTPDECVCVYDSPGEDPQAGFTYERPHVQIRVRGAKGKYVEAHNLARAVAAVLHGLTNETVGATRYIGIWQIGSVIPLGLDDNKRPIMTINFRAQRTTA
jgi:hypothetical protein